MDNYKYHQLQEIKKRGTSLFPVSHYVNSFAVPSTILHGHWHTEWQWIYVLRGNGLFTVGNSKYHANAGDCLFINSGQFHFGISEFPEGCTFLCIIYEQDSFYGGTDIVNEYYKSIKCGRLLPQTLYTADSDTGKEIGHQLLDIYNNFLTKKRGYELSIKADLLNLLAIILKNHLYTDGVIIEPDHNSSRIAAEVNSTIEYIHNNYQNKISLQDIADHVSMSKQSLCRLFKKYTGTTVVDYLNTYRIYNACNILENTSLPINHVARQCGFENTSYFIKLFKKYKKTTPVKYIKENSILQQ